MSKVTRQYAFEDKLLAISEIYPFMHSYAGPCSVECIEFGKPNLCLKWGNFVITESEKEIKVFDIENSATSPIQILNFPNWSTHKPPPYLIVDDSTLYIGGISCLYVLKMQT